MEPEKLPASLQDVPPQHVFWVNNGPLLRNIYELRDELKSMRDETYSYHVNREKNDFSSWARDIIGDEKLARDLRKSRGREEASERIASWIRKAEKAVFR